MGLFGKKDNEDEIKQKYLKFENQNYSEEDYSELLDTVREYHSRNSFRDFYGKDDRLNGYYALRAFFVTVSSKDIVDNIFGCRYDGKSEDSVIHETSLNEISRAWGIKYALQPNDRFRLAINNKSFRNFKISKYPDDYYDGLIKIFNAYDHGVFDETDAQDEESVIFNRSFYRFSEEDLKQINRYDTILRENYPQLRKDIMYIKKSDGTLTVRDCYMIETEMEKNGIDYKRLLEDLLIRINND